MPVASAAANMPASTVPATVVTPGMVGVTSTVTTPMVTATMAASVTTAMTTVTAPVATVTAPVATAAGECRRGHEQASCDCCDENEFTWHLLFLPRSRRGYNAACFMTHS